jgi:hypothetical protein
VMLIGATGLLGLSPRRTASLPGGLSRRQLRATEPRPDRLGYWIRSALESSHSMNLAVFDLRGFTIRRTRAAYTASLLPGCWVSTENACLGDASIGVARNPLRDGAPPTGFPRATEPDVRPAESTKSFALLHRAPGQRRSTWVAACAALIPAGSAGE